ncbi:hypothetical protein KGQ20_16420 [Catenulispora sp. NF23]|uniref:hypothetical protein n=1 Tax=Catenulispora pinistramenti TaxID=2705254 RepID=UPI001BA6769D|nr:hypothetical protein [Catenulispora pinistramenti]MBS2534356.1 hypothetical protein [Catenulispora pinistramenti]
MNEQDLPPVAAPVLADAIDALSPRLRKRLDAMVGKAAAWEATADQATNTVTVTVDEDTRVVLTVRDGAVRAADDAVCSCLLAPACLHRAAVLGLAPVSEAPEDPGPPESPEAPESPSAEEAPDEPAALSPDQQAAVEALRAAAAELLDTGLVGAGLATEATLRRAVHTARAAGLHLPAAIGNRVAAQLRGYRGRAQDHSLPAYADELRALMATLHTLSTNTDPATLQALRGTARRHHEKQGGLRLVGVFSEPVIAGSGMAGVVTCVVDTDGGAWSVPAVTPGGPAQVQNAYDGPVGLGGAALSHRELVRDGVIVSGAAASADGSLSHGAGVRAVRASGASWWDGPIDARFAEPIGGQLERVLTGLAPRIGDDLLFVTATILGADAAATGPGTKPGDVPVRLGDRFAVLRGASDHKTLAYADNLRILSQATGLRIRLIARLDPERPGVVLPIAVSPDPTQSILRLPEAWQGRVCLGVDRLHSSMITPGDDTPDRAAQLPPRPTDATAAIPLHHLRTAVERTAAGGRRAARLASVHDDARRLAAAGMPHAAAVLTHLATTAAAPDRDAYGRAVPETVGVFAQAWLGAALFASAAAAHLAVTAWGCREE